MSNTYYDPQSGMPRFGRQVKSSWRSSTPKFASGGRITGTLDTSGVSPYTSPRSGGYEDYTTAITSDPTFIQTNADISAGLISDRAGADAAILRNLAMFGEVPDFQGVDANLVGPDFHRLAAEARPLAEQATKEGLSVSARMARQYDRNVRAITNALNARGVLRSGEAGHALGEEAQRYKEAQFDSRQRLLDLVAGVQAGYANAQRQAQLARANAVNQAVQTLALLNPNGFAPDPLGRYTPAAQRTIREGKTALDPETGLPVSGYDPNAVIGSNGPLPAAGTVTPKPLPAVTPFRGTRIVTDRWGQ